MPYMNRNDQLQPFHLPELKERYGFLPLFGYVQEISLKLSLFTPAPRPGYGDSLHRQAGIHAASYRSSFSPCLYAPLPMVGDKRYQ